MQRVDIMFDIETLGVSTNTQLLQISAAAFDIMTGTLYNVPFNAYISVPENAVVDGSTLRWWLKNAPVVLIELMLKGDVDEKTALINFAEWCNVYATVGEVHLWGNGILFDNRLVKEKMERYSIPYPIQYRRDRDVRTLVDLYCVTSGEREEDLKKRFTHGVEHNAIDDVLFQIQYVTYCYNYIRGLK